MDPQLTGSDVVTTEDGHLLTLNQVMELGKIEHKFKPTIMKRNSTGTSRQIRTPNRTTIITESYPRS